MKKLIILTASLGLMSGIASAAEATAKSEGAPLGSLKFIPHRIGTFRSEACGVGDFNNDGKPDIVAGPFLYLAPEFKPVAIRKLKGEVDGQGKGYYWDFMNEAMDVDGDGKLDVVSCDWFQTHASWFRNIGFTGEEWPEAVIEKNGNFEHGSLLDVVGDGKEKSIVPCVQRTVWYESVKADGGKRSFTVHVISEKKFEFGVGVGDLNGDGRPDFIRPNAWFEAPADIRKGEWKEHPLALGDIAGKTPQHTGQILTFDVNGDGLNDIICSSAHEYGIFWYEQARQGTEITFKQHLIDNTWSQAHSLALADLDNDGVPELVAGKRFMAHNGGDPDESGPLGLYYYKLNRDPAPVWTKNIVSYNEGIGSSMNICTVDMDGDGDLDIVVTGKWGGPAWFENTLKK
jgi:hypothetical protein